MILENKTLLLIIPVTVLFFIFFVFLFYGKHAAQRTFLRLPPAGSVQRVVLERFTGFFLFGFLPGITLLYFIPDIQPVDLGLILPSRAWIVPSLIFWLSIVVFISFYAKKPVMLVHYPQIRNIPWSRSVLIIDILTWVLYLAAYEFLFRGLLVFPLVVKFGIPVTVIINVVLYTLAHLHKDIRETAGAAVFGIFLVLATIYSGSIWISYISHLVLALSNDFFSYRAHRKMNLRKYTKYA